MSTTLIIIIVIKIRDGSFERLSTLDLKAYRSTYAERIHPKNYHLMVIVFHCDDLEIKGVSIDHGSSIGVLY